MNSQASSKAGGQFPLPGGQFRAFLLFFHIVFLGMLVFSVFLYLHRVGNPGGRGFILAGLVTVQSLLYVGFFAIPSLAEKSPAWQWFRNVLGRISDPKNPDWPAMRWWMLYIVTSVAIVLAECRIEGAFGWTLVAYVGQLSGFPFRISVPTTMAIVIAWLLNQFGWDALASWGGGRWFTFLMQIMPGLVFLLFVGRIIQTSSDRGKLILELKAAKRELEMARQRDAELAVLQERERLARDLHDSLGHSLVTLTVQLEGSQRLLSTDPARAATMLVEMQKLTRSSMEDLRRSLANLRAAGLGDRPLGDALQALCAEASQRSGMRAECELAEGANRVPPRVAEVIWRLAQEGLMNAQKHARAHRVQVRLDLQTKEVVFQAQDDGIGLPADAENKPGHYGLRGLRERVEGLGGTFRLTTTQPRGTLLEARIPLIG